MTSPLERLPQIYRSDPEQKEIADALTRAIADLYTELHQALDNYEELYLNPHNN